VDCVSDEICFLNFWAGTCALPVFVDETVIKLNMTFRTDKLGMSLGTYMLIFCSDEYDNWMYWRESEYSEYCRFYFSGI
jgi:hypothetical protein